MMITELRRLITDCVDQIEPGMYAPELASVFERGLRGTIIGQRVFGRPLFCGRQYYFFLFCICL